MGMQLIETIEVGAGGAASIEFTGIPQDGVDLVCVFSARATIADILAGSRWRFNNNTDLVYDRRSLRAYGGIVSSTLNTNASSFSGLEVNGANSTANTFGSMRMSISNYTAASAKSVSLDYVLENNSSSNYESKLEIAAMSWDNTDSITSIKIDDKTFVEGTTASLYKITAD